MSNSDSDSGATDATPSRQAFDQEAYLSLHPDVAAAIAAGHVGSAWQHFRLHGRREGRKWVEKPGGARDVSREIAAGDQMYVDNQEHYFDVGESALHCIESALATLRRPKSSIGSILDLPCGYGRVMRFLHHAFPDADLTACDLLREGVDFCAKTFGARPVYSHVDPRQIPLRNEFDLIWCGSLLTHLDRPLCTEFLRAFNGFLKPGGLLVFTLHGRNCAAEISTGKNTFGLDRTSIPELLRHYETEGFGYADYHGQAGYGISLARPDFVLREWVQRPEWKMTGYHESAWDLRQDVVAVQRTT